MRFRKILGMLGYGLLAWILLALTAHLAVKERFTYIFAIIIIFEWISFLVLLGRFFISTFQITLFLSDSWAEYFGEFIFRFRDLMIAAAVIGSVNLTLAYLLEYFKQQSPGTFDLSSPIFSIPMAAPGSVLLFAAEFVDDLVGLVFSVKIKPIEATLRYLALLVEPLSHEIDANHATQPLHDLWTIVTNIILGIVSGILSEWIFSRWFRRGGHRSSA